METLVIFGIIFVVLIIAIASMIKIVPQSEQWVIERLGQYAGTWTAGINFKVPFVTTIAKRISTKELSLDIPPQPVITKDNVKIDVDSFAFYRIINAQSFTYGIADFKQAMNALTVSTLRNIIGNLDLEGCLTSRDEINKRITSELDAATDKWGVKVIRIEIKNITPPRDIQQAMDRQMKADRERRETLISADAERDAKIKIAEADKRKTILSAEAEKESSLLNADAAKIRAIKAAEAEKESKILAAQAEHEATLLRAQAQAEAILSVGKAQAESIKLLNAAAPSEAVLRLKAYEALIDATKGDANKVIIPSDVASAVSFVSSVKESLK